MERAKKTLVIGAGPAGLFASWILLKQGFSVDLYDRNKMAGKKFLLAGKSGLNITSLHDQQTFYLQYGPRADFFANALKEFSASDTIAWLTELGEETFTGSGEKVFPKNRDTRALRDHWIEKMEKTGRFSFHGGYRFIDWNGDTFFFLHGEKKVSHNSPSAVFALGGASWPGTGSDGDWQFIFQKKGISIKPFKPMNCAFLVNWTSHLLDKFRDMHLKNISVHHNHQSRRGDLLIRDIGLEGGPLYFFSRDLVNQIYLKGEATIELDLTPDLAYDEILLRLEKGRGKRSYSSFLRKGLHLSPLKISLLHEMKTDFTNPSILASRIKALPLVLSGTDKLEKAISTMGGVDFSELDMDLMISKYPGCFVAGEMADWDSPTGGFLLQGCFTTAFRAAGGIGKFYENQI